MAARGTLPRFDGIDSVGLLALVREGDQEAYGELFVRYHDFAHKVARGASRRHADDLVSEAFRRVLTAISRGAGPREAFGPYLATTIRSVAAGLAAPYQEVELDVSATLLDEQTDVDPRVSTAYASLPEAWQNALWYSDVEGMSPRHAAPLLGLPSANAFSALRKRAHAGLRGAYLTLVVDEACNDGVREHLALLVAGKTTPEIVDRIIDDHLSSCDTCAAIAWRVAAVTGTSMPVALAPALVAFHGFATSAALLPSGLGASGLMGWIRRNSQGAATGAAAAVVAIAVAGLVVVGAVRSGDDPSTGGGTGDGGGDPSADAPVPDDPPVVAPPVTSSTTTTSTTSTTSTTTTTTEPLPSLPPPVPPPTTTEPLPTLPAPIPPRTTTTTEPLPTLPAPIPPRTTTTTVPLTTVPPTTVPPTTVPPTTVPPTTVPPTTVPPTTVPPTTVPPTTSGTLVIVSSTSMPGERVIELRVEALTGLPGTLEFSRKIDSVIAADGIDCVPGATTCVVNAGGAVGGDASLIVVFQGTAAVDVEIR